MEPENPHKSGEWQGDASMPEVLALKEFGLSITQIALRFGVSRETISRRLSRRARRDKSLEVGKPLGGK